MELGRIVFFISLFKDFISRLRLVSWPSILYTIHKILHTWTLGSLAAGEWSPADCGGLLGEDDSCL